MQLMLVPLYTCLFDTPISANEHISMV